MSVKTFFETLGSDFEKLWKKAPTDAQMLQGFVTYVGPIVTGLLMVFDPVGAPIAAGIMSAIETDLGVIKSLSASTQIVPGSTAAQSIQTALSGLQSNLGGLVQALDIKDPATQAKVTSDVTAITTEVNMLVTNLPSLKAA